MHDALIGKLTRSHGRRQTTSLIFACKILLGYRENDVQSTSAANNDHVPGALPMDKYSS